MKQPYGGLLKNAEDLGLGLRDRCGITRLAPADDAGSRGIPVVRDFELTGLIDEPALPRAGIVMAIGKLSAVG
jgi:hypothetical protein